MNWNTAKQLKDSGYPQTEDYDELLYNPAFTPREIEQLKLSPEWFEVNSAIIPSTDSLLEQCPIESIYHLPDGTWRIWTPHYEKGEGETLQEALINLWCTLNESTRG